MKLRKVTDRNKYTWQAGCCPAFNKGRIFLYLHFFFWTDPSFSRRTVTSESDNAPATPQPVGDSCPIFFTTFMVGAAPLQLTLTSSPLTLSGFIPSVCLPELRWHASPVILLLRGSGSWQRGVRLRTGKPKCRLKGGMLRCLPSDDEGLFRVAAIKHESSVFSKARELSDKIAWAKYCKNQSPVQELHLQVPNLKPC